MWYRIRSWSDDHPFLLALIVMLAVVIPGFIRLEQAVDTSREAAHDAQDAVDQVEKVAKKNTEIIGCLITYATDLTDALQDRDTVVKTARAAQRETWQTFRRLIKDTTPPKNARQTMIDAIDTYIEILRRLDKNDTVNPYPGLSECLVDRAVRNAEPAFHLVAFSVGHPSCYGLSVTLRGGRSDDILIGTPNSDVIRGFRGRDLIYGAQGNDTICGGRGNDIINGGQGRDRARGNWGNDFCVLVEEQRSC